MLNLDLMDEIISPIANTTSGKSFINSVDTWIVYDYCTVAYLQQGGVSVDYIHLPDRGIMGNGHFFCMEKNSLDIAALISPWIEAHANGTK